MLKHIIAGAYMLGAILVWIDFRNSPPDGLANVGIGIYTLPVFLLARLLTSEEFPFFSGDYYEAHTTYFVVGVLFITVMIYLTLWSIESVIGRYRKVPPR